MKYAIIALLLLASCKKEDERACYTCIHKSYRSNPYVYVDTTRYCNKTDGEIQQIIDVAPFGSVNGAYYTRKTCSKD